MQEMKVVVYLRVATTGQIDEQCPEIEVQETFLRKFAKCHGHSVVEICSDFCSCSQNMPGLQKAIRMVECGDAAAILAKDKGRIHRDPLTVAQVETEVRKLGGFIFYADQLGNALGSANGFSKSGYRSEVSRLCDLEDQYKSEERYTFRLGDGSPVPRRGTELVQSRLASYEDKRV